MVDGTRAAPAAGDQNAAANKKFVKDDATAKFIILSNLDESQQVCVLSYTTTKEMWDKLCLIERETNKLRLLQWFHAYQISEGDTAVQMAKTWRKSRTWRVNSKISARKCLTQQRWPRF